MDDQTATDRDQCVATTHELGHAILGPGHSTGYNLMNPAVEYCPNLVPACGVLPGATRFRNPESGPIAVRYQQRPKERHKKHGRRR